MARASPDTVISVNEHTALMGTTHRQRSTQQASSLARVSLAVGITMLALDAIALGLQLRM